MIGILFWNTNINSKNCNDIERNSRIEDAIVQLTIDMQCDIIVLAEYNIETIGLCNKLSLKNRDFEEDVIIQDSRIKVISDKLLEKELIRDNKYYVIQNFMKNAHSFLLAGVHFPSKLYTNPGDIRLVGGDFSRDMLESEKEVMHKNTIIVGDFNANPFEELMTDAGYIHAIYDATAVENKKYRIVYEKERQMFYNPMWNFLGDFNESMGTYYSDTGKAEKFYWNIFDQVIISADVIKAFLKESLTIITKVQYISFVKKDKHPDSKMYSDHLPIYFSIKEDLL